MLIADNFRHFHSILNFFSFQWCKGPANRDAQPITYAANHIKFGEAIVIMTEGCKL